MVIPWKDPLQILALRQDNKIRKSNDIRNRAHKHADERGGCHRVTVAGERRLAFLPRGSRGGVQCLISIIFTIFC